MRSTDLWETLSADMHSLFSLLIRSNPEVQIIVLDEPMNFIDYPELAPPMEKAYRTQQGVSGSYENVYHVDLIQIFKTAQQEGQPIWLAQYFDPIHLSKTGNDLLATVLSKEIMALVKESK